MRSKEVEKAIKVIQRDIKDWKEMLEIEIEFEDGTDEQQVAYLTQQITSYETLLSYIEELEEKCKSEFKRGVNVKFAEEFKGAKKLTIPVQYIAKQVIRDKIKELEDEFETNNSSDVYGSDYYIASEKYAFCEEKLKELLEKGE